MTVKALKKKNNMSGPFKMKGSPMQRNFGIGAPMRKEEEEVVKGKTYDEVEVSGGNKTTFDDKNTLLTPAELAELKINPKEGTKYYKNKRTGRMSTIDWSEKN